MRYYRIDPRVSALQTFRHHQTLLDPVPGNVVQSLTGIDRATGEALAKVDVRRDRLKTLIEVARVQSVEASNAIESIHVKNTQLKALMEHKTVPATSRDAAQISGYRDALDLIHSSADAMKFSENVVKQLHQMLYHYTSVNFGGKYKVGDNTVTEEHADGTTIIRFKPVAPGDTTAAMHELHQRFDELSAHQSHHSLLLAGAYIFDFLMIHPFQDGNGRTARLATHLLLYRAGYEVGRYVSLERLINDSRESYYEALQSSTEGWHDGAHSIWPWMEYLLGIITAANRELDARIGIVSGKGQKREAILDFIRSRAVDQFSIGDVRTATGASDAHIRAVIKVLRDQSSVETLGKGRHAKYRRLNTNF